MSKKEKNLMYPDTGVVIAGGIEVGGGGGWHRRANGGRGTLDWEW